MEKIQIGQKVKHRTEGFIGTVTKEYGSAYDVDITQGTELFNAGRDYFAFGENLVVVPLEVGDLVKGKEGNGYGITNGDMIEAKVTEVYDERITIVPLKFAGGESQYIGDVFHVHADGFDYIGTTLSTSVEPKPENKFKIGDIIAGTTEAGRVYSITTEDMVRGEVIEVISEDSIRVKVLEHKTMPTEKGWDYSVNPEHFELVEDVLPKLELQVGDIVEPLESTIGTYSITRQGRMKKAKATKKYLNGDIELEVLEMVSSSDSHFVGREYRVEPQYFAKVQEGFSVGDIVTGTPESDGKYGWTTSKMTRGEVIEVVSEDTIRVKILEHSKHPDMVGKDYPVLAKYFTLVEKVELAEEPKFNVGDKVKIVGNNSQGITHFMDVGQIGTIDSIKETYNGKSVKAYHISNSTHIFGQTIAVEDLELVVEHEVGPAPEPTPEPVSVSDVAEEGTKEFLLDEIAILEARVAELEDELESVRTSISTNGEVEVALPDGTDLTFEHASDFQAFMKAQSELA